MKHVQITVISWCLFISITAYTRLDGTIWQYKIFYFLFFYNFFFLQVCVNEHCIGPISDTTFAIMASVQCTIFIFPPFSLKILVIFQFPSTSQAVPNHKTATNLKQSAIYPLLHTWAHVCHDCCIFGIQTHNVLTIQQIHFCCTTQEPIITISSVFEVPYFREQAINANLLQEFSGYYIIFTYGESSLYNYMWNPIGVLEGIS